MTEPAAEHSPTYCHGCEATDDHPKVLVWGTWVKEPNEKGERVVVEDPDFHFDCLPSRYVAGKEDAPEHANLIATRKAALDGTHGQELRDYLQSLPSDNEGAPPTEED